MQKIDKVQTWEYIDLIMKERISEVNEELLKRIKKNESKVEKQFTDVMADHLLKEGMIGPDEDC